MAAAIPLEERCPHDVLWMILQYLDRQTLHEVFITSKYLSIVSKPLLYRRFTLETSTSLEERCDVILRGGAGIHVRSCRVQLHRAWMDIGRTLSLRVDALRSMSNLKTLIISTGPTLEDQTSITLRKLVDDPPWQLDTFIANVVFPPDLFLSSQPTIRTLVLSELRSNLPLTSADLPILSSIQGNVRLVTSITPQRPIETVEILSPATPWMVQALTASLIQSTCSVQHLSLSIPDIGHVLEIMLVLYTELRHIRSLEMSLAVSVLNLRPILGS